MTDKAQRQARRENRNQFAVPHGPLGYLAGWLMGRTNKAEQREAASLLQVRPGDRIAEIGFGPGQLARILLDTTPAALLAGVDPSDVMLRQALRANRRHVRAGRVDLRLGSADALPFSAASFQHAVAVNSVQMWANVASGAREMARVLVPGGTAVVTWHSSRSPHRLTRQLGLSEQRLHELSDSVRAVFGNVERRDLSNIVALVARRG